MKKFLSLALVLISGITVLFAQVPPRMAYQAVVRDANNWLVANTTVGVKISILTDSINGPAVFAETHTATTNANALVSLQVGTGTPLMAFTLADVDWSHHNFFLKSEIDPTGGTNYTISGVQPLITVPYAFYSLSSTVADSATVAGSAQTAGSATTAGTANVANVANFAYSTLHSDTTNIALHANHADTANYAHNAGNAANAVHSIYADTALYSANGVHSTYSDTATYAHNANNAANANHANYSDTATFAHNGYHAAYSDTATFAHNAANAVNANHATYSDTATYSQNGHHSIYSDTATYSQNGYHAAYSDTATYSQNGHHSVYSDTATYSQNGYHAAYSDTANYAHNAGNANYANTAGAANSATYSDSARISNYSNTSGFANRADTADFNKLLNRPTGTNTGDMLYWHTSDNSWHVAAAGNSGEVLQMDTNNLPSWNTIAGASYTLPTVVTNNIYSYDYTGSTVNVSGYVTNGGGTPFVVSGFCWSTNANPTISNTYSMNGLGINTTFSHQITGLSIGTTYHVRAFAMNNAGVGYGADQSFTTWGYPTVTTNPTVSTISATYAYSGGTVTSNGGTGLTSRGVCWNTWGNPTINDSHTNDGTAVSSFTSHMTGLSWGTTYYVRAYATNSIGTSYGSQVSFTTLNQPTVTTNVVTGTTTTTAVSGGNVTADGGSTVTARGIVWSTWSNPTIYSYTGIDYSGSGIGSYADTMTGLIPGQTYYVRAFATNAISTSYGSQRVFSANPTSPQVTTNSSVTGITSSSATSGGNVTYDGGATVTRRGVCYNTTGNPTIADMVTTNGTGTGSFTSYLYGLNYATQYYLKAYAINSVDTVYGQEVTFTTSAILPTVTTDAITGTSTTTAISGGNVTNDGGATVTDRGIVWSTWSYPDIYSYTGILHNGNGVGTFVDTMTGLNPGQSYYVRAFATNSIGTAYGSQQSFSALPTLPTVTTSASATNITGTTATCGGNVTYDGGATTTRGVCWNTTGNPTINDTYASNGTGTGNYSVSMTGLSDSTTYYVCAYATNSAGTSYGQTISFTTEKLPTVTTDTVIYISPTGATSGVHVLADGGNAVTASGVCWSTSPNPTISNSKSVDGSGTAPFSYPSNIVSLTDTTTYYVRAYATTTAGTAYGQQRTFTTFAFHACPGVPTVSDTDGNVYNTIQIGSQCWMRENLRTTKFPDGKAITQGVITSTNVAFRYYPYGGSSYVSTRGYLYNWTAVMNGSNSSSNLPSGIQGICPNGWHVPSMGEWSLLTAYVSGQPGWSCSGGNARALALNGTSANWYMATSSSCGIYTNSAKPGSSNNMSGFNARGTGYYYLDGSSTTGMHYETYIWSCTESGTSAYTLDLSYSSTSAYLGTHSKYYGNPVRCIKDGWVSTDGQPCPGTPTVADNDGHTYNTVQIGGQCWMKENLRTTKYPDGTSILYGPNYSPTTSTTIGYYYHADNNTNNDATYGLQYNWTAAMNGSSSSSYTPSGVQGICPTGWHLPSQPELNNLLSYMSLGIYACNGTATYYAKALASTSNWTSYSGNSCYVGYDLSSNNASGFSLQPAGRYYYGGYTDSFKTMASLWSTTTYNATRGYCLYFLNSSTTPTISSSSSYAQLATGQSVRCIRD